MYLKIIFELIGGLGMFLFGMELMSSGMQKIAGPRLKKILSTLTNNRVLGIIVGILITALVQSSSVSTVMAVGFVNASLLTLKQALGIILGANIGTTITGWLLVLNIGKYGLPIVGVGAILYMFNKTEKVRTKISVIMGFGFIFLGLQLMSSSLSPIREMPFFIELFQKFKVDSYIGLIKVTLVGALLTAIVQSSAATLGITITLALQGLIDYETAVALVLGENIGTTITAFLASIGAKANAKRAAYAHTLINIIGVIWVTSIFKYYLQFLDIFIDSKNHIGAAIAAAHTIFNISNVIILTPFVGYLDKVLQKIVKDDIEQGETRVTRLNSLMMTLPSLIIDQTKIEIITMSRLLQDAFSKVEEVLDVPEKISTYVEEVSNIEDKLDLYEKEIYDTNFSLLNKSLDNNLIEETRINLLTCDEYETMGDYLNRIANRLNMLYENSIDIDENRKKYLHTLHKETLSLFVDITKGYETKERELFASGIKKYSHVKSIYKEAKREHFVNSDIHSRLNTGYLDVINYYRRIADHIYNIIENFMKI
ncbi:MAG: Na/Pi cotransporter family protein [Fusobacterium gastrosuis]|uniref:Na/Pi cotransporter family protein n=1 Tax=Fusobacterium gastrosuis TaxID=1755100 RepID=UPI002A9AC659|nr:Na/Pi cotransporter family protein [Fusobacteriaceae bacterium]MDY5794528.1 Na/Pi cotransporter family protein [Fusobacterium gastrosuis]